MKAAPPEETGTPKTSVLGGPAPAGPTTETQTSPQAAHSEKYPEVSLRVNGRGGLVRLYQDEPITVSWDLTQVTAPVTGLYLLIEEGAPGGDCSDAAPSQTTKYGGPGEGYHQPITVSPTGSFNLPLTGLKAGETYYMKGCAWHVLGDPQYVGYQTKTVTVEYLRLLPDLVVTDLDLDDEDRLRFVVKNIGPRVWDASGTEIKYRLTVKDLGRGGPEFNQEIEGLAGITTHFRLQPDDSIEIAEQVLGYSLPIKGPQRFTICINNSRAVEEAIYNNNCRMETSAQLYEVDLEIVRGVFHLPKGEETHWHPFRGAVGISDPYAIVQVRNNGTRPAENLTIKVSSRQFYSGDLSLRVERLNPGETKIVRISKRFGWDLRKDPECCQVEASVYSHDAIVEFNKNNNRRPIPTVRE
jgi:hypothetical protein